jgi:FkbM family methyltransferase
MEQFFTLKKGNKMRYLSIVFGVLAVVGSFMPTTCGYEYNKFLSQLISAGDLVFDVGAHIGDKTQLYLRENARVVCIEPQPGCCNKLKDRFRNNSQVTIEQVGLAEEPGSLQLLICSSSPAISTFSSEWKEKSRHADRGYKWDLAVTVPVVTLDSLIEKYGIPQFCKIDVENFEYNVLKGLSHPIPSLSIEFHVETFNEAIKCLDRLEDLGYKEFNFAAGEIPEFVFKVWHSKADLVRELVNYSFVYYTKEKDQLWGDIYAKHS